MQLHNGPVFNLSVRGESYVVPAGITHNCSCGTRAVSQREARELEDEGVIEGAPTPILDDEGNPTGHVQDKRVAVKTKAPELVLKPWKNKRSGLVELVPEGIDPGFQFLPGEARRRWLSSAAAE